MHKVLYQGQNNLMQQYRLAAGWIEEKDLGAMVGNNLNIINQQRAFVLTKANWILG